MKNSPLAADFQGAPHLIGKSGTSPQPQQKLQRPGRQSKPKPNSVYKTGSKPKTKPKADSKSKDNATGRAKARIKAATKAKAKSKPKRDRKKTISPDERAEAELCFFMAEALGCPFNMKADLNPGLDHLDVEERIEFCLKIVKNLRAYARRRREARGMPESWWPDVWGWVRESDPWTNLKEHLHLVFYAPKDERQRMVDLMEAKRKATDPKVKKWCENARFALIDSFEYWTGAKFESAFGYFVKMAHPHDYDPDPTIGYKKSGFIVGPRIKFSPFLLDPDRVEAHRIDVQALKRLRDVNRVIMRRNGSKPAQDPRSLVPTSHPAPAELPAIYPAPTPALATFLTPGSAGPVRRDEVEHREMDVVEVETRLAALAEPVPIPRERALAIVEVPVEADAMELIGAVTPAASAAIDAGAIPAAIDAVVHGRDEAPPLPAGAAITPAVSLATGTPAVIVIPDVPAEAIASTPAPAAPVSASSSSKAVLASLTMLRRAVARTAAACVGWVASRLGARPPPSPSSAARRPRAPLFHPSTIIAAGAFFGAPDVLPDPW